MTEKQNQVGDPTGADDIAVIEANEQSASEVSVLNQEPEIEVLGVYHDDQYNMNIGGLSVDGQEVVFVDVDNDGTFDIAMSDLNHDGVIDEGEVAEVNDPRLNVQNFAEASGMEMDNVNAVDSDNVNDYGDEGFLA